MLVQSFLEWKCNNYNTTWVCICSPRYAACNIHLLYCHLWPAPLYNIFPRYLINGTIFEKSYWAGNMWVDILYNFFSEKFFILRRIEWDIENVYWYSCKYLLFLFNFNATRIFWQIFEKYSNIKFHENPFSRSQVVPRRHTDGQTWQNEKSLFVIWQIRPKKRPFQGVISHHRFVWAY